LLIFLFGSVLVVHFFSGSSGDASTVKEPGHFKVRQSSSQVTRSQGRSQEFFWGALCSSKKLTTFLVVALKTHAVNADDCFTVNRKEIKRSDIATFLFSVHTITEAKQWAGRSQGGGSSSRVI